MITATKIVQWDMAHMLAGHDGACKNLHGHTYKMEVTVRKAWPPSSNTVLSFDSGVIESGPSQGMVVDFANLKRIIQTYIIDRFDHAFVAWRQTNCPAELAIIKTLEEHHLAVTLLDYRPTAENMAKDFLSILNTYCESYGLGYTVIKIKLWETPTSYAEVTI